jgi:pyruvate kinase
LVMRVVHFSFHHPLTPYLHRAHRTRMTLMDQLIRSKMCERHCWIHGVPKFGPENSPMMIRGTKPSVKGNTITLQTSTEYAERSTDQDLFINYDKLHECMSPGMKVLLDDGAVILTVTQVSEADGTVICSIDNSGDLRSRAGVNLPMAETELPAMSEKDKKDIKYGLEIDVDYVAASFIQTADGVREIRNYMKQCAKEMGWVEDRPLPLIISKIETASALNNFDDILQQSDGIMVARGDLGVEIPIQQVTNAQKEMIAACNAIGKPVIVATQMLESMAKNPRPTRAEVSDVTNAVYDGECTAESICLTTSDIGSLRYLRSFFPFSLQVLMR